MIQKEEIWIKAQYLSTYWKTKKYLYFNLFLLKHDFNLFWTYLTAPCQASLGRLIYDGLIHQAQVVLTSPIWNCLFKKSKTQIIKKTFYCRRAYETCLSLITFFLGTFKETFIRCPNFSDVIYEWSLNQNIEIQWLAYFGFSNDVTSRAYSLILQVERKEGSHGLLQPSSTARRHSRIKTNIWTTKK